MSSKKDLRIKLIRRERRKRSCRRGLFGSTDKPRLTVFRSLNNIYCQLVDDYRGVTLAAASTRAKDAGVEGKGGNCAAAEVVGKAIAAKAKELGIEKVQFDRNGYKFHGRVKALAEGAREGGLKF